jgi:hypothetical protein
MWPFIVSGIVYLIGVSVILVTKPSIMFTPDGNWKEFGIGKREDRYTPFPFWLFCLIWAVLSYVLVLLIFSFTQSEGEVKQNMVEIPMNRRGNANTNNRKRNMTALEMDEGSTYELPKGYYVLNEKATQLSGVPKYMYLGAKEPDA